MLIRAALAAVITLPAIAAAHAQEAPRSGDRYVLEKTDKGYVRMDRHTGAMSVCEDRDTQLICRMAADERDALQDEIGRLEERLTALDRRIGALEGGATVPSDQEFERSLGYMERFFRRFMDIVREFQGSEPDAPTRT